MFRHIEMEDLSSAMFDDEETVKNSEGESRHDEKVHGRDSLAVITKKSSPPPQQNLWVIFAENLRYRFGVIA